MDEQKIFVEEWKNFEAKLLEEEKSKLTIEKYRRDVRYFFCFLGEHELSKELVLEYKEHLIESYAPASTNSMLVAMNRFLNFIGHSDFCVKTLKIQKQIFCDEKKELTGKELHRLIEAAGNTRLSLVIQTISGTGIRVSELSAITVQAVSDGKAVINCKNKMRVIFIPRSLQKKLKAYIRKRGLKTGPVFLTRNGNPLNRSNLWRDVKALAERAGVSPEKVFLHNLRHLFARTFYSIEKDIVRLADVLGHSSIDTTRIYTRETGREHALLLEKIQRRLVT